MHNMQIPWKTLRRLPTLLKQQSVVACALVCLPTGYLKCGMPWSLPVLLIVIMRFHSAQSAASCLQSAARYLVSPSVYVVCPPVRLTVRALSVRQSINPLLYISDGNFMVASIVGPASLWTACLQLLAPRVAPLVPPCGIGGFAQLMQLLLRLNRTNTVFLFPSPYSLTCPFFCSPTDTSRAINSQLTNRLSTQRGGKFDSFVHAQWGHI